MIKASRIFYRTREPFRANLRDVYEQKQFARVVARQAESARR